MQTNQRKRQFLLLVPLIAIPLLALVFYALGGGRPAKNAIVAQKGINTSLPGAKLEENERDKLSLYEQSRRDSIRTGQKESSSWNLPSQDTLAQVHTAAISTRLAEINRELAKPPAVTPPAKPEADQEEVRLHRLQQALAQNTAAEPDPEMKQLDGMLSKLLALQNPQPVPIPATHDPVKSDSAFKAIPAIIDGNQKVAPGGIVRLRLTDTFKMADRVIPKGQLLFGANTITNQRLLLEIRNIRLGNAIIPVHLTVFSLDGLAGIDAPGAELAEAAVRGADNAMQSMQFLSMDQTLGTQAATAGITAAKDLLGRKVKKIRVKLKGGQQVLLRINKN